MKKKTFFFLLFIIKIVKPLIYADVINPKTSFIFFTNYKLHFFF